MPKKPLHEDWIAVIIAFVTIGLVCLGLKPLLPKFTVWSDAGTFSTQLGNIVLWKQMGILFLWVLASLFVAKLLVGYTQLLLSLIHI